MGYYYGRSPDLLPAVDKGAEVIAVDENRWTAIMATAMGGHLTYLQYLVDKGAEVIAVDRYYDGC